LDLKFLDNPTRNPIFGDCPGAKDLAPGVPILAGGVQHGSFFCKGVDGAGDAAVILLDLCPIAGVDLV